MDLVYFIANPKEIELPFNEFCRLVGWQEGLQLRGFTSIARERLERFYARYDDLYEILIRLKKGDRIQEVPEPEAYKQAPIRDEEQTPPPQREISEHLRMQWLLLKMGRQAGEIVWAPKNDQQRITTEYNFGEFPDKFVAGMDTQAKYVENIDVVWKQEFRIGAAFEIENSTSIYSGLLRFADLTMVAPNTLYPMFIVAPGERRNRVREQLLRPSFRHLGIGEKVRYLSYEKVNEIEDFFGETQIGVGRRRIGWQIRIISKVSLLRAQRRCQTRKQLVVRTSPQGCTHPYCGVRRTAGGVETSRRGSHFRMFAGDSR